MAERRKKPRVSYHHGDLRRALIDAVIGLVSDEGVDAVSLREVARRAGVSHAAPYHHFADRDELLAAVAEDGYLALDARMAAVAASVPSPRARLTALTRSYVDFAAENRAQFRIMFLRDLADPMRFPSLGAVAGPTYRHFIETMGALIGSPAPAELVVMGWSLVHGLAALWVDGPLQMIPDPTGGRSPETLPECRGGGGVVPLETWVDRISSRFADLLEQQQPKPRRAQRRSGR